MIHECMRVHVTLSGLYTTLSAGTFGVVYKAMLVEESSTQPVAVKTARSELSISYDCVTVEMVECIHNLILDILGAGFL